MVTGMYAKAKVLTLMLGKEERAVDTPRQVKLF